jgi:hypothetical protein
MERILWQNKTEVLYTKEKSGFLSQILIFFYVNI